MIKRNNNFLQDIFDIHLHFLWMISDMDVRIYRTRSRRYIFVVQELKANVDY